MSRKDVYILIALVGILVSITLLTPASEPRQTVVVSRGALTHEITGSSHITPGPEKQLGFFESGMLEALTVSPGDAVPQDTRLAQLELGDLPGVLRGHEASVVYRREEHDSAFREQASKQAALERARQNLLSDGLLAELVEPTSATTTHPQVTGLYTGAEGSYTLNIEEGMLHISGLETRAPFPVVSGFPLPLGSLGLFVRFPDELSLYEGTKWQITIPNTQSASYEANYQAYLAALNTAHGDTELRERSHALSGAQQDVQAIRTTITNSILHAPEDIVVTAVGAKEGDTLASGEVVLSYVPREGLDLEVEIRQEDALRVSLGDKVRVVLHDEYESVLEGIVADVQPLASGSSYRGVIALTSFVPHLTKSYDATIHIVTTAKEEALVVPQEALTHKNNGSYSVERVTEKGGLETVVVTIGIRGNNGLVEIENGLSEGDVVVLSDSQ